MCDRAEFFEKIPIGQKKVTKNGQKLPQNRVFGLFKKFMSLALSGIWVKRKFLWSLTLLLANEISVFNCQYFINRLISNFEFWYVDRHE